MRPNLITASLIIVSLSACSGDAGSVGADALNAGCDTAGAASLSNEAPSSWDVANPGLQVVTEGNVYRVTLTASDRDGDAITYLLKQKADDSMTIDAETGEITWLPGFDVVAACGGSEVFPIQVVARTTRECYGFVDVTMSFSILVLGDLDEDGVGDVDENGGPNDPDIDGDGLANTAEPDAETDECDADSDDDGVGDGEDNCPTSPNPKADCDNNPATPDSQCDHDGDELGDVCDPTPEG